MTRLHVLAVDDVAPALEQLRAMLVQSPEVAEVAVAGDPVSALKLIRDRSFDAVFLDISMPGFDGLELGALLGRMAEPPLIVFVTAHAQHAVEAYGIGAVDYVLKPVAADRLAAAITRIRRSTPQGEGAVRAAAAVDALAVIPVELGGRTRFVPRGEVRFVEAQGDYVRLHTHTGAHLVRIPISRLEEHWAHAGFVRVHRSYLLGISAVHELRSDVSGGLLAHTDVGDVPVSRRHARALRDELMAAAARGDFGSLAGS